MATGIGNSVIIMKLVVFTYCSIVLLFGSAKCTMSLMENEFKDPRYALTDDLYQEFSDDHTGVKRSAYTDQKYTLTDEVYQEYSEDHMGVERSAYKENGEPESVKEYPPDCPDNFGPCICQNIAQWFETLEVSCQHVSGEDELSDVFRNAIYHATHLDMFKLTGNPNIRVLHAGVFQHMTFDEVHIGYNNIEKVERGALDLMKGKVKYLDFHRGNFHHLNDFPFDEIVTFQKLHTLDFSENQMPAFPDMASLTLTSVNFGSNPITSLKQDAFRGLPKLKHIILGATNIAQIIPGTFKGLPNLKEINLTGNHLFELPAGTIITDSLKLRKLILEDTNLSNVEPNSISFNHKTTVDIGDNPVSTLPENVWRPLFEQGGEIWGTNLYLECDCSLAWLVLEPMWLDNVTSARCFDGKYIQTLDPSLFEEC